MDKLILFWQLNRESILKYGKWVLVAAAIIGTAIFFSGSIKKFYYKNEAEKATERTAKREAGDRAGRQESDNNFHELRGKEQVQQTQLDKDTATYENLIRHHLPRPYLPASPQPN